MGREYFNRYIEETYNAIAEKPWMKYPKNLVFRHTRNRKWFALIMELPLEKLTNKLSGNTDIMNLKCDPLLIGSIVDNKAIFPAYHMNKAHWITVLLDKNSDVEKIKWLLDMSFELTKPK
ncbi:MAG: MmcQ/YjbR family DNA-binding protein [Clostridia bacterium]|nr:MmcQ/YjbR family DNA-binding protein [Clostridia bacterium]